MWPEFGVGNSQYTIHAIHSQNIIVLCQVYGAKYYSDIKFTNRLIVFVA